MEVTKEVQLKDYLALCSCYIMYSYNKHVDVSIVDFLANRDYGGVGSFREV
jgi:hypothetical protein